MDVFKQKGLPSTFPPPGTQHAHSFSTAVVKYSTINMRPYVAGYVYGRDLVGMQVLVAVTGTLGALVILSLLGYLAVSGRVKVVPTRRVTLIPSS